MITKISRRSFLKKSLIGGLVAAPILGSCTSSLFAMGKTASLEKLPNIIIIFADDMGYGDLGCFGHPTIRTPNLDRMAEEGMKLTQFYSAAPVCTPSRAALMTGRLPIRNGMSCDKRRVLFPDSKEGLSQKEITIARALKTKNYATCCIGKWHLGHLPEYLPTSHGFDYYYGLLFSNDMGKGLYEMDKLIERPTDLSTLTKKYTAKAITFIEQNKNKPFFLYFPHTYPHVPLAASDDFKDKGLRGLYGDVVEELDWSVGQIFDTLKKLKLDQNTFVIFTSDNGPWLTRKLDGGSAGLFKDGKGSTWEGGMREPCIARWPDKIKAGSFNTDLSCTMDIFATCLDLAGVPVPTDRQMDCVSMKSTLFGTGKGTRNVMFFYRGDRLMAVRKGPWKAHFITQGGYKNDAQEHNPPLLFNVETDPSEQFDMADKHPEIIEDIKLEVQRHKQTLS